MTQLCRRGLMVLMWLGALTGCVGAPAAVYGTAPAEQIPYGTQCFAGFYQCPIGQAVPAGSECSCPGIGAPSYGTVR